MTVTAELALDLAERMAVIAIAAYVLTQFRVFRRFLAGGGSLADKLALSLVFGLMAIAGTYLGIPVRGAIANSRVIGPAVAGLLGGPAVGLASGFIGGLHRYTLGGFTGLSCGLSTTVEGLLAGVLSLKIRRRQLDWRIGFLAGVVLEALQMVIILLVSRPFADAVALVGVIALPMIAVNSVGIAIFVQIITGVIRDEERIAAFHTHKALKIARRTLPHLRRGLDEESAERVARIILETTDAAAVAVTDTAMVLAHVGRGSDHHTAGMPIITQTTQDVIRDGRLRVARYPSEIGCPADNCPLRSGVVVPLSCRGRVVGTLKLYHTQRNTITRADVEFLNGIAGLFATQLELAELAKQAQLATRAELKALRAQINPHFLFNALNTIISFCRTDPMVARTLLTHLADFFRRSLKSAGDLVTFAEELEHVEAFLTIERARFGDRLVVVSRVDPASTNLLVPPFILQPLVENAVKHGIGPKMEGGTVWVTARLAAGRLALEVRDDGVGMPANRCRQVLAGGEQDDQDGGGLGIGLRNVSDRLHSLYGEDHFLDITSAPGRGTTVTIRLPIRPAGGAAATVR